MHSNPSNDTACRQIGNCQLEVIQQKLLLRPAVIHDKASGAGLGRDVCRRPSPPPGARVMAYCLYICDCLGLETKYQVATWMIDAKDQMQLLVTCRDMQAPRQAYLGLTRAQAVSLDKRVRVNTVLPGWIVTPGSQARLTQDIHNWHLTGKSNP